MRDRRCGYRIYGREFIRVGEKVMILGREYSVMTCEISFKHNSIETCVNVYPLECFQADKIQADRLKGVVIEGEVLQTKGEVLRLHLDIDDEQDVATAYDYPWRPIIGNMLYCILIKIMKKMRKLFTMCGKMESTARNWQIIITVILHRIVRNAYI